MTIDGTGHTVIVDGNNAVTVITVIGGVTASLTNVTIQHGSGDGGGIHNDGAVTVTNSTLSGNSATTSGGGIDNDGGIFFGGTMTVTNSTLSGNSSDNGSGGGIYNAGVAVTVTNSTLSGNRAKSGGGIYYTFSSTVTVSNTIVAGNTATTSAPDLKGTITSGGYNLIGNTTGSTGITDGVNGDIVNPTPLLGTLGNYGGPTQTIPLLAGSPAIGHGDAAICTQASAGKVNSLDQRGVTRPTTLCAIGAFEPLLSAIGPASGSMSGGTTVTLTGAGYAAGAAVSIGGVSCTNVQIVNSTTLRCTTGAHAAGAVDVVVTVGSATGTLTGGYTYGALTPLPGPKPPGGSPGSPSPLPGARPPGTTGGPAPNPLPAARP